MSYGTPSKGLMQVIEPSYTATVMDPLANMTAAVNYARSEYSGDWADGIITRPRMAGKATEMAEIMERVMVDGEPRFAEGGLVSPTGRIKTWLSPGEFVMTPEMARAAADRALDRMGATRFGLPFPTELDEVPEPPDDYPEPPALPCW